MWLLKNRMDRHPKWPKKPRTQNKVKYLPLSIPLILDTKLTLCLSLAAFNASDGCVKNCQANMMLLFLQPNVFFPLFPCDAQIVLSQISS